MSFLSCLKTLSLIPAIVLALGTAGFLYGQDSYHISHFTSRDGLPQNSVRGLVFDRHGFLWLATEGGIARFDGRTFRAYNELDHTGLKNQRFTEALACNDSSILFVDLLKGIYLLSGDQFSTLQKSNPPNQIIPRIKGNPPSPMYLMQDTIFAAEAAHVKKSSLEYIQILPGTENILYLVSNRIIEEDVQHMRSKVLLNHIAPSEKAAMLNGRLLLINSDGHLRSLNPTSRIFEDCRLTDDLGHPVDKSFIKLTIYNTYPFANVFLSDGLNLFRISPTGDPHHFILHTLLDKLPESCIVNEIAYREPDQMLVLGTDSRGVFIYHKKHFNTFTYHNPQVPVSNTYYAQCLLDSSSLLASNGIILDLATTTVKGIFPQTFNPYLLYRSAGDAMYYMRGFNIYKYSLSTGRTQPLKLKEQFGTHFIGKIDDRIWLGTTIGIGSLEADTMQWVYRKINKDEISGIQSISPDPEGNIWFGSYFQLYRMDVKTHHIDSFPAFVDADIRVLKTIRNHLYIGTNGSGYYIYHQGHFYHMPSGRKNELSHTHNFIEDKQGYLWIPTNHGLFKTHLDAIDAYLKDTTNTLDYYAYLEEDGIRSTEFNGGCSPPHLWLPDGRLSLPTIEGLVMFKPEETPHFFTTDSMLIESIEVDGVKLESGQQLSIPFDHTSIRIFFAGAWWSNPANQYVYYKLEGFHAQFRLGNINQASFTVGHLKPGNYTFVLKRRIGFGPLDYVYSRQYITVLKPWYLKNWAYFLYGFGFLFIVWATSVVYAHSIRLRNKELQKKVDEQTAKLLNSNIQLEENLQKLAASEINLRKNIKVRDRLISIITHDILTPLRFIGQIARLGSEDKPEDPGMARRALTDVQNATYKLFHSTQNLLHWVSYQQEKFKTISINCSPFAIVEQLMEDFKEMSRFQDNTLINEVHEDDVILADPNVLTIVLHNLLSNAIKYTQHGQITVRSGSDQNWYVLEVRDTGRGMTYPQLEAIRKGTATQGDTTLEDVTAGNGIGLTLVADLMRTLHGRWEIDSPEGGGTRVRIFLSIEPEQAL